MHKFNRQTRHADALRRRHPRQRGSALLIVFVFAAIAAIMLYKEMPVAAFEAQRQREELLISRGNEYKRGVKLFVRKIGRFPTTINELEDTNRMRFLRHRYVDPLTGKDDWRLIHAGPGGVIIDSQIGDKSKTAPAAGALGQGATFAGFNNSFSGDTAAVADAAAEATANPGLRVRAPATKNASAGDPDGLGLSQGALPQSASQLENADPSIGSQPTGPPGQPPTSLFPSNQQLNDQPAGLGYPANQTSANQTGFNQTNAPGGNGIGSLAQQLGNVNPQTPQLAQSSQSSGVGNFGMGNTSAFGSPQTTGNGQGVGNGQMSGTAGGIAGVASKAPGKSIKNVNDQTKYAKWEFYYDMQKEQSGAAANALQNMGANNANGNGANGNSANGIGGINSSAFGQTQQQGQSSFGQSSLGQSSAFGFNSTQPVSQPPPQQQPPQQQ